ncbi:acetylornithine deacetylase [Naegleria gruberi]|uniref:Acetylornithine deacetylase n=1 Tax=Naegleria gruberi TaxID=5762 RepID=D2VQ13_NAEGR|nr:uncharacterized protein NAEGRDRAFT_60072 [Naegleria gruberi]XP_002673774.1 acetylornithine deacetylase [Naegleria gruberi]EFC35936.1 predicted protein [Naegleria gruberi]EFC41030.1 acetylornithine deacetylase [Naegleria gruberi]|eukprot:XP_002668680.1 predicted protein [Naegleria gruberi strain NEG-M]
MMMMFATTFICGSSETASKIKEYLNQHKSDVKNLETFQRWVRYPSLPEQEHDVQIDIAKYLKEELKFNKVDIWTMDEQTAELENNKFFNTPRSFDSLAKSPIVVGVLDGSAPEEVETSTEGQVTAFKKHKSLIINGHIDVVPVGNPKAWYLENPFSGHINNSNIYGRGTTDMKGGLYAGLLAIEAVQRALNVTNMKGKIIVHSVVEEESGGAGTVSAVLRGYGHADAGIFPEPSNFLIFPQQQGSLWFRITVHGKSAHGGTRYDGISAIEKSQIVLNAIKKLEFERTHLIRNVLKQKLFENITIPVPINVGVIKGGEWPSSVPDFTVIEGRFGIIPNYETVEDAKKVLNDLVFKIIVEEDPEHFNAYPSKLEFIGASWVPGYVPLEHEFVSQLTKSFSQVTGQDPIIASSPWATDAGYVNALGNTPSVVFGPGVTHMAHQTNEYIPIENIYKAAEVIANTIVDWCGV